MSTIQTIFGWATLVVVSTAYLTYTNPAWLRRQLPALFERPAPRQTEQPENQRRESKPKASRPKKPKSPEPVAPVPDSTTEDNIVEEEGQDAVAFARAIQKAQKGTDSNKKETAQEKPKKKKGKKSKEPQVNGTAPTTNGTSESTSAKSSLPAADAEPSVAPKSGAAGMSTDVGPSAVDTIRITQEDELAPVPQQDEWTNIPTKTQRTKQKVAKQEQTKQQRQRTAEKERQKEAVAAAEAERKKLMEAQLRRARIARGEPARNGEAYRETSAPAKSVWGQPQQEETHDQDSAPLLDTLDAPTTSSGTPSEARTPVIISSDDGFDEPNGTEMNSVPTLNGAA